jgi:hypothetical protein
MVVANRTNGPQYAVKYMFDRQVGFPGAQFSNTRQASQLLATSLLSNTGASGGSLTRVARGIRADIWKNNILLAYRR